MTVLVAIIMALLTSTLLALAGAFMLTEKDWDSTELGWGWIIIFVGLSVAFAKGATGPRNALARGLVTAALESFLIPLAGFIITIVQLIRLVAGAAAPGSGLAPVTMMIAGGVAAIIIGVPCLIVYFRLKPAKASSSRWWW